MGKERPQIVVVHRSDGHGCLITLLLLLIAWPLAIIYWVLRMVGWLIGLAIDWLTLGPIRRLRR